MSGIAGLVMLDGAPADAEAFACVMSATAHRAVDGSRKFASGSVALGHQLLDVAGEGPVMGEMAEADDCIVTADCRLDNREELLSELAAAAQSSDAQLILAAYRRWGDDMPSRLLGDFAFALWDRSRNRLLCARDHFGIKPFYYALSRRAFAFSSEQGGVLACGWIDAALNEDSLAAYLASVAPKAEETLYRHVKRLPPAHLAVLDGGALEVRPYWRLQPIDLGDEDAAAGLRRRLETAVADRLRGAVQAGAMLSGGLDSSTIVCFAAPLHRQAAGAPLKTFSLVFDETPQWNERPYIETVLTTIDAAPCFIPSNGLSYVGSLPELLRQQHGPFGAPNHPASRRIYDAAREDQVRVLLDGHGGDEVVSQGLMWLPELAASGRWIELWRQLSRLGRNENLRPRQVFWAQFKRHARIVRLLRPLKALLGGPRPPQDAPSPPPSRFLQPAWAERADALGREAHDRLYGDVRTEQAHHLVLITGPLQAYALEILDKGAATAGVEARYPLWDKRVVEFCYSVAPAEKLKGGRTRSLIRRAMTDMLPERVRDRSDKFDFMPHLRAGLAAPPSPDPEGLFADMEDGLGEILRLDELKAAYGQMLEAPDSLPPLDVQALWRCAALASWWRLRENRPPKLLMSCEALA